MNIEERIRGHVVIIEPQGRLTVETEAHFIGTINRLLDAGRTRLALNMAAVSAIDCRGLGAIAHAYSAARARGGDMKLFNLTPRCRTLLAVTRLLTVVPAYDSEAEATRSFIQHSRPSPAFSSADERINTQRWALD